MSSFNQASFSKIAMLSLALSVSTSCAQVAAAAPHAAEIIRPGKHATQDLAKKAKLRENIKRAMTALAELHANLSRCCQALTEEESVPRQALDEQPFTEVVDGLRRLEESVPADSQLATLPVIGEEYTALRRQLALSRSLAVRAEILVKQRLIVPQEFNSDVDGEGLKALADMATDRLARLVS